MIAPAEFHDASAGSTKWSDLLDSASKLFFIQVLPSEESSSTYSFVAKGIIEKLGDGDRQAYAERFADSIHLPHDIAIMLARCENPDVARAILALSPVLADQDLVNVALNLSQQHLLAIAERNSLSEPVTDALVDRGSQSVLLKVSHNAGAVFSNNGFHRLLTRGGHNPAIAKGLAGRTDLDREKLKRLARILDLLAKSTRSAAFVEVAHQQRDEMSHILASVTENPASIDKFVISLARGSRAYHLAEVLAKLGKVKVELALKALMQRDVDLLASLCRVIGIEDEVFQELVLFQRKRLRPIARSTEQLMTEYRSIGRWEAERRLSAFR